MQLGQCKICNMVFAVPMPSDEVICAYNASYFMTAHGGIPEDILTTSFFSAIASLRIRHVERYLGEHKVSVQRVLEIGPGMGILAKKWLQIYPGTEYWAVETDTSCHASLVSAGIKVCSEEMLAGFSGTFDLVIMSHVLEHVADPIKFIKQNTILLREGGVLFIEVPCNDWQHKAEDEPHLLFFDKQPMIRLIRSLGFGDATLQYYGRTIEKLKKRPVTVFSRICNKLNQEGFYKWVAAFLYRGDHARLSALERAVIAPYQAHIESVEPAWWLRTLAKKGTV